MLFFRIFGQLKSLVLRAEGSSEDERFQHLNQSHNPYDWIKCFKSKTVPKLPKWSYCWTWSHTYSQENLNFEIGILTPENCTWASSIALKVLCIQTMILHSGRGAYDPKLTVLSLGTVKIIIPPIYKRYRVIVNHYGTT